MAEGGAREEVRQIDCVDEGGVAALCKVADDIGVRDIVNSICSKRKQGMSVGDYILIAALNRALAATSKSKVKGWVDSTALHLYLPLDAKKLESQNFWDHFEKIDADMAEKIGDAVARRVAEVEKIDLALPDVRIGVAHGDRALTQGFDLAALQYHARFVIVIDAVVVEDLAVRRDHLHFLL